MSDLTITVVPTLLVQPLWRQVEDILQRVVDVGHGEISTDSIRAKLVKGDSLMVIIADGETIIAVNTLEVRVLESGLRILYIPITGGDRLNEWMKDFLILAKNIARDYNCTRLRGLAVRKGWMRVLKQHDWHTVHEVIECEVKKDG